MANLVWHPSSPWNRTGGGGYAIILDRQRVPVGGSQTGTGTPPTNHARTTRAPVDLAASPTYGRRGHSLAWRGGRNETRKPIMRPAATAPARPSCPRDRALLPCHLRSCSWWPFSRAATSRTLALLCFACLRADFGGQERQRRALTRRMTRLTKIAAVSLARSSWPGLAFASGFGCRWVIPCLIVFFLFFSFLSGKLPLIANFNGGPGDLEPDMTVRGLYATSARSCGSLSGVLYILDRSPYRMDVVMVMHVCWQISTVSLSSVHFVVPLTRCNLGNPLCSHYWDHRNFLQGQLLPNTRLKRNI